MRRIGSAVFPGLVLAALVCLCFGRVVGYPFLSWDDNYAVTDNPLLAPPSFQNLARFWTMPWTGLYVPASFTFLWIEAWISSWIQGPGNFDPRVFHLGTLVLHVACAGVVLRILRKLVRDDRAAFLGALLFAIHPVQTESVAWVTETRGVLATLFGLLAAERALAAASSPVGLPVRRTQVSATVFFVLALLSKPSAAALPLIVLLLDRFLLGRPLRKSLPLTSVWLALSAGLLLFTKSQQAGSTIRFEAPVWARPLIAFDALAFYVEKLFLPVGLAADYGRKPAWLMEQPILYAHWIVPVALAALLAFLPGRRTWLLSLGIFVAGVLPVLGLVSFNYQDISTVADRYLHLSMLGPALAFAVVVSRWGTKPVVVCAAVLLAGLGVLSWRQAGLWSDTQALFRHSLEVNPRSPIARINIGLELERRGRIEEAAQLYREAIALDPNYPVARNNLGHLLLQQEKLDEAIDLLRETVRIDPAFPYARTNLAIALVRKGALAEAEDVLREAVRLQPGDCFARGKLGNLLLVRGRPADAVRELETTLELCGRSLDAHAGLAEAYAKLGQRELAAEHQRAAQALRAGRR